MSTSARVPIAVLLGLALCAVAVHASAGTSEATIAAAAKPPVVAAPDVERVAFLDAIARGIQRAPTLAIALAEIRRSDALTEEARSGWLPTLAANGIYTGLDHDRRVAGSVVLPKNQIQGNLFLTVPIVDAQKWAPWWHAKDNAAVARLASGDTQRLLAASIARAYLAVVVQRRVIDIDARAVGTAKAHYEYAHARYTGGIGTRLDEVRAAQDLATDTAQLESAWAGLERVREALGVVVGEDHPLDVAEEPQLAGRELGESLDDAAKRPDVAELDARARAADRVVRDDWTDYMPTLLGTFMPFLQDPPTSTYPTKGFQAQLLLNVPLYDGGLRYGLAKERKALANEGRLNLEQQLRQAKSEVRTAYDAMVRADRTLDASRGAAALTHEALDLANLAYRAGAATNIEVIDAQRSALDADTQVAAAEDTVRQARLDLLVASGKFPNGT